jgi:hypothetical protein
MPRAGNKRLARLGAGDGYENARARGRVQSRLILAICAEIRAAAVVAGIEPASLPIERDEWWANHYLTILGDTPEVERRDAALAAAESEEWAARHSGEPDPRDRLMAELDERSRRYCDGSRPAPEAPLWDWYAWARVQSPAAGVP